MFNTMERFEQQHKQSNFLIALLQDQSGAHQGGTMEAISGPSDLYINATIGVKFHDLT